MDSMEIIETSDRALLREALRRDAAGTLYMTADLESPFFEQCRWLVELEDARAAAVVLAFFGLPNTYRAGYRQSECLAADFAPLRSRTPCEISHQAHQRPARNFRR